MPCTYLSITFPIVPVDFAGSDAIFQARNQMAKALGYEDYYDYKVTQAEVLHMPSYKERIQRVL